MQPTLAIIAPAPGLLSINGRFCGELAPDMPLYAPVHPFGAVYLEYRPFTPGWTSMARRLGAEPEGKKAVVLVSPEMEELIGLCNRIYVMYEGEIRDEVEGERKTQEVMINNLLGVSNNE